MFLIAPDPVYNHGPESYTKDGKYFFFVASHFSYWHLLVFIWCLHYKFYFYLCINIHMIKVKTYTLTFISIISFNLDLTEPEVFFINFNSFFVLN